MCLNLFCCRPRPEWDFECALEGDARGIDRDTSGASNVPISLPMKNAFCPSCGAPVKFQWSSAVQTVCPYCRSILVRHDVNLEAVGNVADLPDDPSPIQIGTEGIYRNKPFVVIGRILYEYEQGRWNEWHLIFNDGTSGWLSDASLEYAVSFMRPLPPERSSSA